MKNIAWLLAFFLVPFANTYSQWEQRYPLEYDYPISGFIFVNAKIGFYSTANGVIQKTFNSCKSWQRSVSIKADGFLTISFADSNYGFAYSPYSYLNDTASLFLTTDGGSTWHVSGALSGGLLLGTPEKAQSLYVKDSIAFITFEDGSIMKSSDKLNTWKIVRSNCYYMPSDYGIPYGWISSFFKMNNGSILAVGNDFNAYQSGVIKDSVAYILKSTDYGDSWNLLWRGSKNQMHMVSFADTMMGWMCSDSAVYKTTNGGISWTLQLETLMYGAPLVSIAAIDTNTIYAIDLYGSFHFSTTGGDQWETRDSFVASTNTKLQFFSKDIGYGGGTSGLFKTTNGGVSWTKQTGDYAGKISKLEFANDNIGYAIVDFTLYKTINGGYAWTVLPQSHYSVFGISVLDSLDLWIASSDTVLHSTDGGISWTKIHIDSGYIHNIYFFDKDFGVLYDVWNNQESNATESIIVTTDGGFTWKRYQLPKGFYDLKKLFFISKQEGWFAAQEGLFHTLDGGQTWQEIFCGELGNPWNYGAFSFDFVDSDNGWFAYYDLIYNTTDGGQNWHQSTLPFSVEIKDMKFIDRNNGFTIGGNGRIFSTSNAGVTWTTESNFVPYNLYSISTLKVGNTTSIRIGGEMFTILVREITTSVAYDNKLPKNIALFQNYPNPFNPSTTISFTLPSNSLVSLKVFDILGRAVATLVSEKLSAGKYLRQWNAVDLPSGVYFYRLQAGSFMDTKKLVLIR